MSLRSQVWTSSLRNSMFIPSQGMAIESSLIPLNDYQKVLTDGKSRSSAVTGRLWCIMLILVVLMWRTRGYTYKLDTDFCAQPERLEFEIPRILAAVSMDSGDWAELCECKSLITHVRVIIFQFWKKYKLAPTTKFFPVSHLLNLGLGKFSGILFNPCLTMISRVVTRLT